MKRDIVEIPVTLKEINSEINVVSFKIPGVYFREPFFIDSLAKNFRILKSQIRLPNENELLSRPVYYDEESKEVVLTPIKDFIAKYSLVTSSLDLEKRLGFIFHMSRCGSTLFTQMLGSSNKFFVLSEPTIINAVLDPLLKIDFSTRERLLKACIRGLNSCSPIESEMMIIKFRSWNILFIDLILGCFKKVPWIFIHRDGVEVLASVIEKPPGWLRSKNLYTDYFSQILNIDTIQMRNMESIEFGIRLLGRFCIKAKEYQSDNKVFLDYNDIKADFFDILLNHWGIELTESERTESLRISSLYSKDVENKKTFTSDKDEKQKKITKQQRKQVLDLVESERHKLI